MRKDKLERLTYSVAEACEILGLPLSTAYNAIKRGDLHAIRIGQRVIVPKWAVDELVEPKSSKGGAPRVCVEWMRRDAEKD